MMKTMTTIAVVVGSAILSMPSYANAAHKAHNINLKNNEQSEVSLSYIDTNRIFVNQSEITEIHGPQQRFVVKNDESGSIYLTPNGQNPFTLFFDTENKQHFSLLISPKSIPGQTIEVTMPIIKSTKMSSYAQNQFEYQIESLVRGAISNNLPEGYSCTTIKNAKAQKIFGGGFVSELTNVCSGESLTLSTYIIKNNTHRMKRLNPSYFYHDGIASVALQHENVKSGGKTVVYEVSKSVGVKNEG